MKTEQFATGEMVKAFQGFTDQAERGLAILNAATSIEDLFMLRSNRLEALRGDRVGHTPFVSISNGVFALNGATVIWGHQTLKL